MDGFFNGRFTEELLRVWDSGRFKGDYAKFHKKIVSGMPPTQTPNHYQVGCQGSGLRRPGARSRSEAGARPGHPGGGPGRGTV